MQIAVGNIIQVEIERLVVGGNGLARHEGAVIFVPKSVPQDQLKVKITEAKKNFYSGEIVEIVSASPFRREAPCGYFSQCGGCSWQHIGEEHQLKFKHQLVNDTFRKFLPDIPLPDFKIIPSPKNLRYRNRIQPNLKDSKLGFFAANTHNIVEIDDCLITEEKLMALWPKFKKEVLQKSSRDKFGDESRFELYLDENETPLWYEMNQEKDSIGFSQVNRFQNHNLIETVVNWATDSIEVPQRVFDFYAGAGNFSFPLSSAFKKSQVIAVELHQGLARAARKKAENLKLSPKQFEIYGSDVHRFVKNFKLEPNDLILLDPPRAGSDAFVMRTLAVAKTKRFLYVSCHPVTLARDLGVYFAEAKKLGSAAKIARLIAFDMFPQTDHVELLAEVRIDS